MNAIVPLADVSVTATLLIVIVIALAVIALLVSLWLYRGSRGPRLIRCPYCRKVIQWGITPCPNCSRPLTWVDQRPEAFEAVEE